jgi:hypothetical protein
MIRRVLLTCLIALRRGARVLAIILAVPAMILAVPALLLTEFADGIWP